MKQQTLVIAMMLFGMGCSNPYCNPQASKAVSEREQLEQAKIQNELLKEQNIQLKRVADALENSTKNSINYDSIKK